MLTCACAVCWPLAISFSTGWIRSWLGRARYGLRIGWLGFFLHGLIISVWGRREKSPSQTECACAALVVIHTPPAHHTHTKHQQTCVSLLYLCVACRINKSTCHTPHPHNFELFLQSLHMMQYDLIHLSSNVYVYGIWVSMKSHI